MYFKSVSLVKEGQITSGLLFSDFLSIFTGSLMHEHYTRECEFENFDKKQKQHKKNTKTFG